MSNIPTSNNPHTITVKFKPDGSFTAKVTGIQGPGCEEVSAWLDQLGEVTADVKTADYYQQQPTGEADWSLA
jgi:hypothetical protein